MPKGEEQRYDFNFSKMQIMMIFGGVCILVAVMFALGMVVGRSVSEINTIVAQPAQKEPTALPEPIPGVPATAEHAAPASPAPETAGHEIPAATATPPQETVAVQAPIAAAPKAEPHAPPQREAEQPLPLTPVVLPEPTIMPNQAPHEAQPSQSAAKAAETKPEPAATPAAKAESAPAKKVSKPRSKPRTTASRQALSPQKYMLQAASFSNRSDAENLIQNLKKSGFKATIMPIEVEGRGTWYRVRTGPYRNRQETDKNLQKLQQINSLTPMVIASD